MTIENAKALLEKCKSDKELWEKLQAADQESFEALTSDAGLACSLAEVNTVLEEKCELSDEDLEGVVGGAAPTLITVAPNVSEFLTPGKTLNISPEKL